MHGKHTEDGLEAFFREKEKEIKDNNIYTRFMFVPVVVIALSMIIIFYNFFGVKMSLVKNGKSRVITPEVKADRGFALLMDGTDDGDGFESRNVREDGRLNLNTASVKQLDALPEIGLVKAGEIVKLREEMGGFRTVEDILNVDGVGEKILEEIKDKVFVE